MRLVALVTVALLAVALTVAAQTPVDLFTSVDGDSTGGDPPPGVAAVFPVTVDLDALAANPVSLSIDLPDHSIIVASRNQFQPRAGFDGAGVPLPGNTIDDLSFLWQGVSPEPARFDVVLTFVEGWISGHIIGAEGNYSLAGPAQNNLVHLTEPPVDEEPPMTPPPASAWQTPEELLESHADRIDPKIYAALVAGKSLPERIFIDVLPVYTEQARIDAGGNPSIPQDKKAIRAEITGAVDDTNVAFANSGINVELRLVPFLLLLDFTPTGNSSNDRLALKRNETIIDTRTAAGADMVAVVIRNTGPLVNHCGFAFVQRPGCGDSGPIEDCDVGIAYKPWAIHWSAQNCARKFLALGHEIGHGLGGEHQPETLNGQIPPERASFVFSFGDFVDEVDARFRTMMAIISPPRILNFSNPDVFHLGHPTGRPQERHNARTIEILSVIVASFNSPKPDLVFASDFDDGDLLDWSATEP